MLDESNNEESHGDFNAKEEKELRGISNPEVDKNQISSENVNTVQESDYPTGESKRKFICESFKIDEKRYIDKVVQMFLDNFSALVLHASH